ncbi:MAG: 50S ribosomal protein L6 [Candidatus Sifarchaeia archaeon]|jgi:large subunit ribosomal protein L6
MVKQALVEEMIEIPKDVSVDLTESTSTIIVKGPKGELKRDFSHAPVSIIKENNVIKTQNYFPRKKERALVGTIASHIRNMLKGVTDGFIYKMKVVYSHFPISVEVKGKVVLIKNFTGERSPRKAHIIGNTSVRMEGKDTVLIEGIDIEEVAQTAANIQQSTKIRKKDIRVFMDGIYVSEKIK